ncbi:MAG: outer membrane beta-barrel protein [Pyrinomonadaceae bacterium]|nr:outer membrane beta-barrel protein [Sphingobacteriaceae bacterium]
MPQKEHMKSADDKLIAHIAGTMREYEEQYIPGRWDNFDQQRAEKKSHILWFRRYSTAAAILLFGVGFYLLGDTTLASRHKKITEANGRLNKPYLSEPITLGTENSSNLVHILTAEQAIKMQIINKRASSSKDIDKSLSGAPDARITFNEGENIKDFEDVASLTVQTMNALIADSVSNIEQPVEKRNNLAAGTISFEEFLKNEAKVQQADPAIKLGDKKTSNWEAGIILSPSFGRTKKINVGYGLSMAYALTDKMNVSSGIAYNEMASSRRYKQEEFRMIGSDKSLEYTQTIITGIDIPLEVKYHLSKNIYANMGVSAFAILNENRNYTYVEAKMVERAVSTNTGGRELKTVIENQRTTLKTSDTRDKLLGLYNFSLGYKQKISQSKSVSVEPFMKVQIKNLSDDSLPMMGAGVRLKLEF